MSQRCRKPMLTNMTEWDEEDECCKKLQFQLLFEAESLLQFSCTFVQAENTKLCALMILLLNSICWSESSRAE